jgi:hypothetical protein
MVVKTSTYFVRLRRPKSNKVEHGRAECAPRATLGTDRQRGHLRGAAWVRNGRQHEYPPRNKFFPRSPPHHARDTVPPPVVRNSPPDTRLRPRVASASSHGLGATWARASLPRAGEAALPMTKALGRTMPARHRASEPGPFVRIVKLRSACVRAGDAWRGALARPPDAKRASRPLSWNRQPSARIIASGRDIVSPIRSLARPCSPIPHFAAMCCHRATPARRLPYLAPGPPHRKTSAARGEAWRYSSRGRRASLSGGPLLPICSLSQRHPCAKLTSFTQLP